MKNKFLETIKIVDGQPQNLSYHQNRYERTLYAHKISHTKKLFESIKAPSDGLYRCRLIYSDSDISTTYHRYEKRRIKKLKLMEVDELDYSYKYLDREKLNLLFDQKGEADDVLIVKNRLITDTTIANIAFLKDGVWFTPRSPLLKGTTRERLLDEKKIVEEDIRVRDIYNYEKIALFNAMIDFDIIHLEKIEDIIC